MTSHSSGAFIACSRRQGRVKVVGACYALDTSRVDLLTSTKGELMGNFCSCEL